MAYHHLFYTILKHRRGNQWEIQIHRFCFFGGTVVTGNMDFPFIHNLLFDGHIWLLCYVVFTKFIDPHFRRDPGVKQLGIDWQKEKNRGAEMC